jgi:hypothetical protein
MLKPYSGKNYERNTLKAYQDRRPAFCVLCGKGLKSEDLNYMVEVVDDGADFMREGMDILKKRIAPGYRNYFNVGRDCARRLRADGVMLTTLGNDDANVGKIISKAERKRMEKDAATEKAERAELTRLAAKYGYVLNFVGVGN